MSLEKIYFSLWTRRKLGKKEFLKSYIVLLRVELKCTIYASQMGRQPVLVRWQLARPMYDFKNSFFLAFVHINRAKYIFSRDMFCLPHFWAEIHSVQGISSRLWGEFGRIKITELFSGLIPYCLYETPNFKSLNFQF